MVKLLAPNGKPSNLTSEQYKLVRTDAFKNWFGDWENDPENASKVIDENGEPLVVFHGTTESFSVFNNEYSVGHYFTSKIEVAKTYSNNTISCFLDIKNPTYWDVNCRDWEDVRDGVENLASSLWWVVNKKESQIVYINKGEEQINMQLNCDGIIIKNIIDVDLMFDKNNKKWCADTIIVSSSNQIKLADGTNTTFDSNNNDIRFDDGGRIINYGCIINKNDLVFEYREKDNGDWFDIILKTPYLNPIGVIEVGKISKDNWKILNVGIKDNCQGLGYGKLLYEKVFDKLSKSKGQIIYSDTTINSPFVHKIWEKYSAEKLNIGIDWNGENKFQYKLKLDDINNPDIRYTKGGKLNKNGDCYYMAGQLILNNEFLENKIDYIGTPYLVHAEVQGQGAISNLRYGHAWIEDDVFVYDYSNNRKIVLPKDFYYRIGDIKTHNPKKYRKYNFEQAKRKMLETKNYGCWDLEVEYKNGGAINNNLKKEQVNKTIFHKSNPMFRQSILKKGLIPKAKSENWLSDTAIDGKVIFATNTSDINKLFDSGYDDDIYEIDTTGLNNKWYLDPNFSWSDKYNHIITFEPIPLSVIKLIYKGSGKSNDEYKNGGDVPNEIEKISKSVVNDLGEQYSENDYLGKCKEISEEIAVRLNKIKIEAIPMRIIDGEDKKYNSPVFNHAYTFLPKTNQIIDTQLWQLEGQPDNLKTRKVLFNWDDYNNLVELYEVEPISDWENRFSDGGEIIINPTEIECHKCHWHWKVKDGGDDLFICHKCYTDNTKFYKFEGLKGEKILDTISYKKGGRTISQTPAPKKDQIKGSDKNKEGSAKDISSAKKIKFADDVLEKIQNSVDKHNKKHSNKKITIDSAKAVVRRGMGAYSSTHRPTISGGNENSRVAWGLARLNAFMYKIVNGKSKSGKYSQDNDLIEELGYKVEKYEIGGIFQGTPYDFNAYSTEYIGTGEGNQVFGWGLYFTDVKDIARYYMSAGLYDDEQKIMLNGKSLSKYKIQQEVKDQLVGIVDTIFGEDKMIPTLNLIKGYLVLEYDEENYPELKEIVELCNKTYDFIKDKKLSFIGNIYSVTLFKGKNPDEYDLLEWEQKPTEIQISKIKNQAKKEGVDLTKLPFDLERYRDSNAIYTDLSYIISGVSHLNNIDSGKMCSEFLLRAGFDGIRYKAGTLSGFEDEEGYNYVIFDANDITIEGKEKYDEILAGKEKYADGGELEKMKNLFLQNGFTEDELQIIVEENPNYFNQIEFYDDETIIVYRTIALPRRLVDKFIQLDKQEIGEGIGEYWTLDKEFGRAVWGGGHYEGEKTFDITCVGHLKIKDIDWQMMKYAFNDDGWHFGSESEIRGVNGGNSIKVVECRELYSNGGDIQAYEEAMGISEFNEGGEAKPKKVYVSIRLDNTSKKIPNTFMEYFNVYSEKPFEELKNGKLEGLVGVSSSPNNIAEWFIHRDCLIVMDYEEFIAINETEIINYYDPYQLMKNNLYLFKRLYANITRYGEQEGSYVNTQTLTKILEKIIPEIRLEINLAEGQKYKELYRIETFLSPYVTRAFPDWLEKNQMKIESPVDLTYAILEFNQLNEGASYLQYGFENPVLTFDELLPIVEKGITNASSIYDSEQEIVLTNRILNIPKNSQLFFVGKDEVGNKRESNKDELIEKYNLKELYKVYFVDAQQIQKYRGFWLKKEEEKFNKKEETGKQNLEIKKSQVTNNLIDYFIQHSIDAVIDKVNKEILSYESGSLEFYDSTKDDYEEINWVHIPLIDELFSKYTEIVEKSWEEIIKNKSVNQVNLYSFNVFQDTAYQNLKTYFEQNKDKYEELENYRNTKGRPSLQLSFFSYDLLKSLYDYEDLPEWINYKELSKMYLNKMGIEIYRYYDKKDLPLISQYKDGGSVLLAPNGKPSNLTPEQYKLVRLPEFKAWFGDWENDPTNASKVVDENGEPLVVYHATNNDFNIFDEKYIGSANDRGFYGKGFYFTFQSEFKNINYAINEALYYGGKLLNCYIKALNPFDISILSEYKSKKINLYGTKSLVFLYNVAILFPQIADKIFIEKKNWNKFTKEYDFEEVPISILPNLVDKYANEVKYIETNVQFDRKETMGYVKSEIVKYEYTDKEGKQVANQFLKYDDLGRVQSESPQQEKEIIFIELAIEKYDGISVRFHSEGYMTRNSIITDAIKEKHDCILQSKFGDELVVFNPNQIKLADGTNTTFDTNNNDIRFDEGGETDEPTNFWGTEAGGVLVYCSTTDRYLILLRSENVLEPNTWGIISGKLDDDETNIQDAVFREAEEETGHKLGNLIPSFIFEKQNFKFHNFVSIVNEEFTPELNWENSHYKWVKLNEMPDNLHFGLKLLLQKENIKKLVEKNKNNTMNQYNPKDEVTFNIPLLIRFAELMREDIKTDVALHEVIENIIDIKDKGTLTMGDYESIVGNITGTEENTNTDAVEEEKMAEGGKVSSIKSKKGDIKINLDENWYSDDTNVELVPVSELIKFREFDRKLKPKYNQDNSRDNINHLKFMFQKDGVKEPIIIEYSAEDDAVLIIEGNHRINSAIDLGMEYLPARIVLKKYGKYSPEKLNNTMKVNGIKANSSNYIPSDLKPSQVGITGTLPITYAEGGIIEGKLHSECDDDGCGVKFQVGENGHIIEAERDEAVIVAEAFNNSEIHTIEGTLSQIASALNVIGGGKNFDDGAKIIDNKKTNELLKSKKQEKDTDVDSIITPSSIIINRRSMADTKKYRVTGTTKQIASSINSIDENGVVIEEGGKIEQIN